MSGQEEFSQSHPHPTVGGNLFDPRVHGEDVRGAGNTTGKSSLLGEGSNIPPAHISIPGLTQDTRGLTSDSSVTGGNTQTEGSGLTSTTSNEKQGIVPTVLSYVGLGGSGTNPNAGQVSDYDSSRTQGDPTAAGIGSGERDGSSAGLGAASGRESSISGTDSNNPRFAENTSTSAAADTTTDREPTMQDQRNVTRNATDAPGANEESTPGQARSGSTANAGEEKKEEKKESSTGHGPDDKPGAKRENPSSIPVAGGTRLGEAHWGESKIVPDNPKPSGEEDRK